MENDIEDKSESRSDRKIELEFLRDNNMPVQKKARCNRSFFIALFLVVAILGVYTIHYKPSAAKHQAEKQHTDWLKRMQKERGLQNDTLGYRHYERHEVTQSDTLAEQSHSQISMVMPANVQGDLHRAQTSMITPRYVTEKTEATNRLIEMKLDQSQIDADKEVGNYNDGNDIHEARRHDNDDANRDETINETGLQKNVLNETATDPVLANVQTSAAPDPGIQQSVLSQPPVAIGLQSNLQNDQIAAPGIQPNLQTEPVAAAGMQPNVYTESVFAPGAQSYGQNEQQTQEPVKVNTIKMQLPGGSYAQAGTYDVNNPIERPGNIRNSNIPSNNEQNKPIVGQQNLDRNPNFSHDNVPSDNRAPQPLNINAQSDTQGDRYRLSQTYQNNYDRMDNNIGRPLLNMGMNRGLQGQGSTTASTYTLPGLIERRMVLHKTLKNMLDIVNYGSPATDEDNKKPWNEGETRKHLYDVNDKSLFDNLVMQINRQAEPVTGTRPMRPPYKSRIEYPSYLTPVNWIKSFETVKTPIFECVPMRTINSYIRICIHPPAVNSEVSSSLKSAASWEYSAVRDVQRALLQHRDAVLIDLGASFGVFSLAAAALNRNVIAVEPFPSHIQVFKQSVTLNSFGDHITLFQAVVSDRRGKVLIKPLDDHVNNIYVQTVEDDEQSTNYTLVVNTVTLDDIEKVCPSRIAVLKIDIPGFTKKALEYSHFFFKYIYVTHVFMHWDTSDKELCLFILRFFVERGYTPYSDLYVSKQLELKDAYNWPNDTVIWKL